MFTAMSPALAGPAFASDPAIDELKELQFNVGKFLSVKDQEKAYFEEGKNPIVEFILRVINFALTIIGSIAIIILIINKDDIRRGLYEKT